MTLGDRTRTMTDEQITEWMFNNLMADHMEFCQNKQVCDQELDAGRTIPDDWCKKCFAEKLREEL